MMANIIARLFNALGNAAPASTASQAAPDFSQWLAPPTLSPPPGSQTAQRAAVNHSPASHPPVLHAELAARLSAPRSSGDAAISSLLPVAADAPAGLAAQSRSSGGAMPGDAWPAVADRKTVATSRLAVDPAWPEPSELAAMAPALLPTLPDQPAVGGRLLPHSAAPPVPSGSTMAPQPARGQVASAAIPDAQIAVAPEPSPITQPLSPATAPPQAAPTQRPPGAAVMADEPSNAAMPSAAALPPSSVLADALPVPRPPIAAVRMVPPGAATAALDTKPPAAGLQPASTVAAARLPRSPILVEQASAGPRSVGLVLNGGTAAAVLPALQPQPDAAAVVPPAAAPAVQQVEPPAALPADQTGVDMAEVVQARVAVPLESVSQSPPPTGAVATTAVDPALSLWAAPSATAAPILVATVAVPLATGAPLSGQSAWADQVAELTLAAAPGEGQSRARLNLLPDHLGAIAIDIAQDGDKIELQVHAETAVARQAFEEALPRLRAQFAEQGLNLGQVLVDQGGSQSAGQSGHGATRERSDRQPAAAGSAPERDGEPATAPPRLAARGLVDHYA